MAEITRLNGRNDRIDLDSVERERTPEPAMKLGIRMHLAGLSLLNIIFAIDSLGLGRSRKAVHDRVQKADLQPTGGKAPNQITVDETVIRINDQQFRLYAAANPQTNELLYLRLFSTTTTVLTEISLNELRENRDVESAVFLADGAKHLQTPLQRAGLRFRMERHGNRNAIERVFRVVTRRTISFSNCFSHVEPETAETWLRSFARWHNAPD